MTFWELLNMPPEPVPDQPASVRPPDPDDTPVLPLRSPADTDVGWSEQPEPDDDERLNRDRPPHWDS
jgi:hypothetical protein